MLRIPIKINYLHLFMCLFFKFDYAALLKFADKNTPFSPNFTTSFDICVTGQ